MLKEASWEGKLVMLDVSLSEACMRLEQSGGAGKDRWDRSRRFCASGWLLSALGREGGGVMRGGSVGQAFERALGRTTGALVT
jgi:hypothetical protein